MPGVRVPASLDQALEGVWEVRAQRRPTKVRALIRIQALSKNVPRGNKAPLESRGSCVPAGIGGLTRSSPITLVGHPGCMVVDDGLHLLGVSINVMLLDDRLNE